MGIHRSIAGLGIGGSIDIGDALASLRSLAVLEEDPYIPEVLVRMRMAWASRRDQPSIRIYGLNWSLHSVAGSCFVRTLDAIQSWLERGRRDIEQLSSMARLARKRIELINAYIGRHSCAFERGN
jgi:hypothetical protein